MRNSDEMTIGNTHSTLAYQNARFRQIMETGRVFDEIFLSILYHCTKVGCIFSMVVVSLPSHAESGRCDHWEDKPHYFIHKKTANEILARDQGYFIQFSSSFKEKH